MGITRHDQVPKDGRIITEIGYPINEMNKYGKPLGYQTRFHNSQAKYRLMSGGFGTGGTTALAIEMAYQLLNYPNNTGLLGRFDSVELEATTLVELFEVLPEVCITRHDKTKRVIYLYNGSRLIYTGLDDSKKAVNKIKSMNLGFACIDQLEEIQEDIFLALQGRLRRQHSERCFFAKCNPEGHNWAYHKWVEEPLEDYLLVNNISKAQSNNVMNLVHTAQKGNITLDRIIDTIVEKTGLGDSTIMTIYEKSQYEYFPAVTMDNIYLPPEYINELLGYPEKWKRRYVYNSWDNFEGLVYNEFKREVNVETAYIPQDTDAHIHIYDYGFRNPACVIFTATDFDGIVHIYDEIYEPEMLIADQAKLYKQNKYWRKADKEADPSINKAERDGRSVFDSWNDLDVYWSNADNDVRQGIDRVNQMLLEGKIKISKRCVNLLREIQNYKWKAIKVGEEKNEYEEPVKKDDHAMDCLRYLVNKIWTPTPIKPDPVARPFVDELYGTDHYIEGGDADETSF
jgi:PBSX family phage terminase large subunit